MTLADIVAEVNRIKAMRSDSAIAHRAEDALRSRFLAHVAYQGPPEMAEMAREVLRVDDAVFARRFA